MGQSTSVVDKAAADTPEDIDPAVVMGIVEKYGRERGSLIAALEEIQAAYGYLPDQALRIVANGTGRSLVDVYGVATFYRSFSLQPRGKRLITVCLGTACHVRGGQQIVEEFQRQLRISAGETTADREFTLETVNCLGACALGPIVVVDGVYFPNVDTPQVKQILKKVRVAAREVEAQAGAVLPLQQSRIHGNTELN